MPHLNELHQQLGPRGLVIVAVHTPWGADNLEAYVRTKKIAYPVALDTPMEGEADRGRTLAAYQVDSFPDYYLVDRKGILRYADVLNADVDRAIAQLLAEPA